MSVEPRAPLGVGLNVDREGRWTGLHVAASGASWARYVLLPDRPQRERAALMLQSRVTPVLVLARESLLEPYSGSLPRPLVEDTLAHYAAELDDLVPKLVIQPGNEWDGEQGGASWVMPASDVDLLAECAVEAFPGATFWGPACSSGQPARWRDVTLRWVFDAVCINPYGRQYRPRGWGSWAWQPLREGYQALLEGGQRLVCTEVGARTDETGGEAGQAAYLDDAAAALGDLDWAWFCADDAMVPGYGLEGKAARAAFARATRRNRPMPNNAEIAWGQRWRSLVPEAAYHHDFGLETAWRSNADAWGYPLGEAEEDFDLGGAVAAGRVFSKAGVVCWDGVKAVVLGWP